MPSAQGSVPNLINGISQQNPATRLTSQAEASENFYPTVVDECKRRPPSEHLASLGIDLPDGTFTHFILRDDNEKYVLAIFADGTIKVWDLEGNEKSVTNSGASYLTGLTNPDEELRALTIADHTFIVNRKKTVLEGSTFEATRPYEALINVRAGNYGRTYSISIDGSVEADYQTPDGSDASHSPYIDTTYIAAQLRSELIDNGFNTSPWSIGRYHSTLYLRNTANDFNISIADGYSGQNMKEVKDRTQKFSDLPHYAPHGVVVEVMGDDTSGFDNYWVRFEKVGGTNQNSAGVWKECLAPGARKGLDGTTMPHILVRNANGTFTFKTGDWEDRVCGDEETVPDPSFVGSTIEDVFFYRNRLGLLTNENVVISEAGRFYNFYRTTLTALLDSDPIDIAASHVKVSLLHHAVPYSDVLLLFSDQTQFRLQGNELFTPKTVNARPLSELSSHPLIRPVVAGTSVFFISERGRWATLVEYFIDKQIEDVDSDDVGAHAPAYIPAGVRRLVASPDLDLVITQSSGDPNKLYGYRYFWNGQEKLQSAWFRWDFPGASKIVDVAFDKTGLLLLVRRGSTVFIERLECEQGRNDPGLDYSIYLDHRVLLDSGAYNSETDKTTFTLPFAATSDLVCVTAPSSDTSWPPGIELPFTPSSNTIEVDGDLSAAAVYVGREFTSRYVFSRFYYRDAEGRVTDQDGRLQVLTMMLAYINAAYFRVEVETEGRPKREYPFTGRVVSDPDNVLDAIAVDTGKFSFPVMSRNDRVTISIVNDSWRPSAFSSARWRGTWNPSSRQQ